MDVAEARIQKRSNYAFKWWEIAFWLGVISLGFWISLQYTLASWGTDADVAGSVMLWWGVKQHGLAFLQTWGYTPDNWLLSLVPLEFLQFWIVGVKSVFVVLSGWFIFIACVGLSAFITYRTAGVKLAIIVMTFLLFARIDVLGWPGFFTYPETHNISVMYGLLAFLFAGRWFAKGTWRWLAAEALALIVNCVSDPWSVPTFFLPIFFTCMAGICLAQNSAIRGRAFWLALICVVCGVTFYTKVFGAFWFLPDTPLAFASWNQVNDNAVALLHAIGGFFFLFPVVPLGYPVTDGLSFVSIAALTTISVILILKNRSAFDAERSFLLAAGVLSVAGVAASFILLVLPSLSVAGRYLLNIYVIIPVLVAAGVASTPNRLPTYRIACGTLACIVSVSGATSLPSAWLTPSMRIKNYGTIELAEFLLSQGLHRGYGDYFATQSSAVSWMSKGQVVIRPVSFDQITGEISPRPGQTSPFWYDVNESSQFKETFTLITSGPALCEQISVCVKGVTRQFGVPDKILVFHQQPVLVWDRPLALHEPR